MTAFERLFAGALVATMVALPAYAQTQTTQPQSSPPTVSQPQGTQSQSSPVPATPTPPADEDAVTDGEAVNEDVSIEDSAILPSAGGHEESRAPSMELDCEKNPEECSEPLTTDSPGPTLSTPTRQ